MSHGAGGKATQTLIEAVFLDAFRNPLLEPLEDAARLDVGGARLALTTDSYVVSPLFFPGGDIGDLAVNGTVNDLSVSGADPAVPVGRLHPRGGLPRRRPDPRSPSPCRRPPQRPASRSSPATPRWWRRARPTAATSTPPGVGLIERTTPSSGSRTARPGDAIIVSGPIGDHGVTIMLARGELDIEADIESDTAPLNGLVAGLLAATAGVRALRDATRGGVATILNEIAKAADVGVLVTEDAIPVRAEVRGASELLGIDPMYVACEGRLVAVVDGAQRRPARWRPCAPTRSARGRRSSARSTAEPPGIVQLKTAFGGTRIVDLLVGDPLPRIC